MLRIEHGMSAFWPAFGLATNRHSHHVRQAHTHPIPGAVDAGGEIKSGRAAPRGAA
jgi:hypothetical protein